MKVLVLVENTAMDKRYKPACGLSFYIEHDGLRFLYDTGPDDTILVNALQNEVDLDKLDFLVLSHGHLDHTGGLKYIKCDEIYAHKNAKDPMRSSSRNIGMPNVEYTQVNSFMTVREGIHLLTNDSRKGFVPENDHLYRNGLIDDFAHELMLIIEFESELYVFSGCSHLGVTNMIYTAEHEFQKPVTKLFGGMHLKDYNSPRSFDILIDELEKMETVFYTGHCTGPLALSYLGKRLGNQVVSISSGKEYEF